jgi:light-regulated signal transduction histidine kinase (bacteriophytochrome)
VVEGRRWLGTLYLRSDLGSLDTRVRLDILVVLLAVAGSIGVAFVLSTWLQRGIAHPVRALAEAARSISERNDYSIRVNVASDDELGLLTTAFNGMLGEIQQRDADLERRVAARTAELQALNRELEAFSYSVSHDLRAPVRHIDGFADLLKRHSLASLDEKGQRYLAQISESAHSMGQLIDDLLVFSRMGRVEMRAVRVNLDALVRVVREAHATEMAGRSIEWRIPTLPDVEGDPAMLRVVFTNLIANAIKYTSTRAAAHIEIGAEPNGDEVTVFVRDDGVGFDMAYVHKLFGVFQRLHSADEFEGTGIGLANVRRIVERHGGKVRAEGQLDRGATFYVTLPSAAARGDVASERKAA